MAINFLIKDIHHVLGVDIKNFNINMSGNNENYSIHYNKERAICDIKGDIKSIGDINITRLLTLSIISLIKSNLKSLDSTYKYQGASISINRDEICLFNHKVNYLSYDFDKNNHYDWNNLLLEIVVNLRKYIIDLKEIVGGHIVVNNTLIQNGSIVKVKNRLHKIEKLYISPGNRDICIVKYYFNNEFYVEYESDLIKYINNVSNRDSKLFEDYYAIVSE